MDYSKFLDTVAERDSIFYSITSDNGGSVSNNMDVVAATMFDDSIEILGKNEGRLEIPIDAINNINYLDDENVMITTDIYTIMLWLKGEV